MDEQLTGRVIDGRYVVEAMLGKGGMGVVVRARHQFTNAQVALKMLHRELLVHDDLQKRFLAEAKTPSAIGHPGIVQVFDAGKTPEGELYLVMELLTGRTLRHAMYPSPPPPEITRRIMLELLDALGAAHARGIVHRDLKPENVFLAGPAGTVKLLDFGIAKVLENSTRAGGFTEAGSVLGTLQYMAPEQLTDASSVDHRTDLWAVGVMVYELVSGRLPYRGTTPATLMQDLVQRDPEPIATHMHVSPAIEAFLARALSRDRDRRFLSAHEMAAAIAGLPLGGAVAPVAAVESRSSVQSAGTVDTAYPPRANAPPPIAAAHPPRAHPPTPAPQVTPPIVAAAVPPPTVRPPSQPPPAPSAGNLKWIALVGGTAAIVTVIVVAIAMSRGSKTAPSETAEQNCVAMCDRLATCSMSVSDCKQDCLDDPRAQRCSSARTCDEIAGCVLGLDCGGVVLGGPLNCAGTMMCVQNCKGDKQCACTQCFPALRPTSAAVFFRVIACAADKCEGNFTQECLLQHCEAPLSACRVGA